MVDKGWVSIMQASSTEDSCRTTKPKHGKSQSLREQEENDRMQSRSHLHYGLYCFRLSNKPTEELEIYDRQIATIMDH